MSRCITCWNESPCHNCEYYKACGQKIMKYPKLIDVWHNVFRNADMTKETCSMYIVLKMEAEYESNLN